MRIETEKPKTTSTPPEANMGSRAGKATLANVIVPSSSALTDLKIGHCV
jgi:hypothetical protein